MVEFGVNVMFDIPIGYNDFLYLLLEAFGEKVLDVRYSKKFDYTFGHLSLFINDKWHVVSVSQCFDSYFSAAIFCHFPIVSVEICFPNMQTGEIEYCAQANSNFRKVCANYLEEVKCDQLLTSNPKNSNSSLA